MNDGESNGCCLKQFLRDLLLQAIEPACDRIGRAGSQLTAEMREALGELSDLGTGGGRVCQNTVCVLGKLPDVRSNMRGVGLGGKRHVHSRFSKDFGRPILSTHSRRPPSHSNDTTIRKKRRSRKRFKSGRKPRIAFEGRELRTTKKTKRRERFAASRMNSRDLGSLRQQQRTGKSWQAYRKRKTSPGKHKVLLIIKTSRQSHSARA